MAVININLVHGTTFPPLNKIFIFQMTEINCNSMLCPAISDPFEGKNYRLWALGHQHLLILIHAKLYVVLGYLSLTTINFMFKLVTSVGLRVLRFFFFAELWSHHSNPLGTPIQSVLATAILKPLEFVDDWDLFSSAVTLFFSMTWPLQRILLRIKSALDQTLLCIPEFTVSVTFQCNLQKNGLGVLYF